MTPDTKIHPYWFQLLARQYDARSRDVARTASELRKTMGSAFEASHSRLQKLEYGSMGNRDFDSRIQIARALSDLTFRWQRRGSLVANIDASNPDCATRWLDVRRGPIFLDLRPRDLDLVSGDQRIEGAYLEPTPDSDGSSSAVTFVTRQFNLRPESATLGALLTAQSTAAFCVAADPENDTGTRILMSDASLARDGALVTAISAVHSFLFLIYAHQGTHKRNAQSASTAHRRDV